jgi:hypothetical protein
MAAFDGAFLDFEAFAKDHCGYCGEGFPNYPEPNWELRLEHLVTTHKAWNCNQAKKFFRDDHFRKHLKHSHAGKSGEWTKVVENACMKDEDPIQPTQVKSSVADSQIPEDAQRESSE